MMRIRLTEEKDLPRVMEIYAHARRFMAEHGNPRQWGSTCWPPEWLIREDIACGRGRVCEMETEDGARIVGAFCYMHGEGIDHTYDVIEDGAWTRDGEYGVVHRIAAEGARGVGRFCLGWALEKSGYLRIDTHPDNRVMQNLLTGMGFEKRGIIHVEEDDDPRFAFDRVL